MRLYLLMPPAAPGEPHLDMFWSFPKYRVLTETQDVFQDLATFRRASYTLTNLGTAERITGEVVGAGYFGLLGVRPFIGRTFLPAEDTPPAPGDVVVLGYNLWQTRFVGDRQVLGKSIRLNAVTRTIVGVLPAGFRGLSGSAEYFLPTTTYSPGTLNSPGAHNQNVIARLRSGATVAQAMQAMPTIGQRIDEAYPDPRAATNWSAHARTLEEVRAEPIIRTSLLLLLGAVGFVLLIACANLANLLLGRAAGRQRELAIRLSIGAGRNRIVRQLLTESAVLALLGGLAGLMLALPGVGFLRRIAPQASGVFSEDVSGLTQMGMEAIRVDVTALVFMLGITVLTGMLFGLVPALQTSRPDLTNALKEGGRSGPRENLR